MKEETQKGLDIFNNSKKFTDIIFNQSFELEEEVNKFYDNIDTLVIDVQTCVEFWGLKTYFNNIIATANTDSDEYESKF